MAIIVAVVAFCLSGIFLLFLVPDPDRALSTSTQWGAADVASEPVPEVTEAPESGALQNTAHDHYGVQPEFGRGTYAPLGGMGGPPRRFARHLPIERHGATQFLPVDDVVAIHANSHYTFVFNGTDKLFCPLAIGEVESRLDNSRFVRIHRSHIVNIERVVGYKRSGDNEMVEMAAAHDYAVPVSRSRVGWLKTRVAALMS